MAALTHHGCWVEVKEFQRVIVAFFILASLGSHCGPLEGQLQEEHAERAAGRADEREAA